MGSLTAMEARLGCKKDFVFVAVTLGLSMFSLSLWLQEVVMVLCAGIGEGAGKKLEILKGTLFEGPKGGFFSDIVFSGCFKDATGGGGFGQAAAMALVSCFNLVFLSSAN